MSAISPARTTSSRRATAGEWPDRFAVIAAATLVLAVTWPRVDPITTDSASYLDVARNVLAGDGLVQRIVDFWRPTLPDPLGLWPPLYPLLVAAVAAPGIPLEAAGRAVSAAAFVAFALALRGLARRAVGRGTAMLTTIAVLTLPAIATAGALVWSELPFLVLVTLALSGLGDAMADPRAPGLARRMAWAGVAAGLATLTRYQGLPLPPLGVALLLLARAPRGVVAAWTLPSVMLPAAWVLFAVGSGAQFGPTPAGSWRAPTETLSTLLGLLRWGPLPGPVATWPVVATLALVGCAAALPVAWRRGGAAAAASSWVIANLAALALADVRGMFQTLATRFMIPIVPFVALAVAAALAPALASRRARFLAPALAVVVAAMSAWELALVVRDRAVPPSTVTRRAAEAEELRAVLEPEGPPVLSNVGHLVRLATGRSAVQVPPWGHRLRDFGPDDEARWIDQGVRDAVFHRESWAQPMVSEPGGLPSKARWPLGSYLSTRIGLASGSAWRAVDSTKTFVRYRLEP